MTTPIVSFQHESKKFQDKFVLNDITFTIEEGEFISILGKSGCGKSTLLNLIGGFEEPSSGKALLHNQPIRTGRNCIMLFQEYGLLPWRSVIKNVELGLESLQLSQEEKRERSNFYVQLVGLEENKYQFPHQLSGGMKQRVAIARALVMQPDILLMDEPFAALDTFNRYYLQDELLRIQEREKTTIVLVTHDIDEAIYLSDRIFIMNSGPGHLQRELDITLAKPRDRSSSDFQYFRKTIFEHFHFDHPEQPIEYNI